MSRLSIACVNGCTSWPRAALSPERRRLRPACGPRRRAVDRHSSRRQAGQPGSPGHTHGLRSPARHDRRTDLRCRTNSATPGSPPATMSEHSTTNVPPTSGVTAGTTTPQLAVGPVMPPHIGRELVAALPAGSTRSSHHRRSPAVTAGQPGAATGNVGGLRPVSRRTARRRGGRDARPRRSRRSRAADKRASGHVLRLSSGDPVRRRG